MIRVFLTWAHLMLPLQQRRRTPTSFAFKIAFFFLFSRKNESMVPITSSQTTFLNKHGPSEGGLSVDY
jgi:hypothetical protein